MSEHFMYTDLSPEILKRRREYCLGNTHSHTGEPNTEVDEHFIYTDPFHPGFISIGVKGSKSDSGDFGRRLVHFHLAG